MARIFLAIHGFKGRNVINVGAVLKFHLAVHDGALEET